MSNQELIFRDQVKIVVLFFNNSTSLIKNVKSKLNKIVQVANIIKVPVVFNIKQINVEIWNNECCYHFMESCNRIISPVDELFIHVRAIESSTQNYKNNSYVLDREENISKIKIILLES